MKNKEVKLEEIVDFKNSISNGSSFTKKFVNKNKGLIPVYGATQLKDNPSYGFINENIKGVKYFENCLTWNIDGSLGCFYREGKFCLSEKVIPLYINEKFVNLIDKDFLAYRMINWAIEQGFNREYKPNKTQLKKLIIKIPLDKDGLFDIKKQKEISKNYKKLEELKNKAKYYLNTISNSRIAIEKNENSKYVNLELSTIFDFYKGNSKYTKKYFKKIKNGKYPLYSAATKNNGIIANIDTYDWDTKENEWITWTTDGIYAGTVFIRKGKFSMNTHCGLLKPKRDFIKKIDIKYIAMILEKTLPNFAFGDQNKRITIKIIEKITINIPVEKNGDFDLEKQKEIYKKYKDLKNKKTSTINYLKLILNSHVKIEKEINN